MQAILENEPEYADVKEENLTYYGRVEYRARKEALKEGLEEGLREGRQQDVLDILAARGLAVPEEVRARILATRELALLRQWITRAVTVLSADQIFA